MSISGNNTLRYNEEYFGYIVGFPEGKILLVDKGAKPLLEQNRSYRELLQYELKQIEIIPGFHLNTPPLVWLEITKRCNLTCPHCYIDGGASRENELSPPEIHALIDQLADMGVWAIAITGGEPTLHPHFIDFVRHARRRGLLVGIATHGLHLSDRLLSQLPTDGIIISISVDNLHIENDSQNADFESAKAAFVRCKRYGIPGNIMTNTNRKNIDHLKEMMQWAEKENISVRSVPFSPIGDRAKANQEELENIPEDVNKAAEFWLDEVIWEHHYHEEVGLCVGLIFNYGLTMAYMSNRCSSGRYLCYICSDGTTYPCTMCAGEKILSPGNIRSHSDFATFWRSDWEIRNYSWDNFKSTCQNCPLNNEMYYCSSKCPATSHARHGTLFSCGASDFEKVSLVVRTSMLNASGLEGEAKTTYLKDRPTHLF